VCVAQQGYSVQPLPNNFGLLLLLLCIAGFWLLVLVQMTTMATMLARFEGNHRHYHHRRHNALLTRTERKDEVRAGVKYLSRYKVWSLVFTLHQMREMQAVVADDHGVCLSVCLSVT